MINNQKPILCLKKKNHKNNTSTFREINIYTKQSNKPKKNYAYEKPFKQM